jgi:hypothetical protein
MTGVKMKILLLSIFGIFVAGCSTMTSFKANDFVQGQAKSSQPKSTIMLCRPPSIAKFLTSYGIGLNNSPILDIGSGEKYSISHPKISELWLDFYMPEENLMLAIVKKPRKYNLKLKENQSVNYVLVLVDIDQYSAPYRLGNLDIYEMQYKLGVNEVSEQTFNKLCNVSTTRFITH